MSQPNTHQELISQAFEQFIAEQRLPRDYIDSAQEWFIPLAKKIIEHQKCADKPLIVGVNGCQGSGKSTLTALLTTLLQDVYKVSCVGFSIDDFYLSKQDRTDLAKTVHPLFATRGVPGTHDIKQLAKVLDALQRSEPVKLPVFDKSTDDIKPANEWNKVDTPVQVIIIEGWCVGLGPQMNEALAKPVNELEAQEDSSGHWRKHVNDALSLDYSSVFSSIDYLIMLQAPSFEQVYRWRCEQEHKLADYVRLTNDISTTGNAIMSDTEVLRFIQFYQRLTEHALTSVPAKCNSIFTLDETRCIKSCLHQ